MVLLQHPKLKDDAWNLPHLTGNPIKQPQNPSDIENADRRDASISVSQNLDFLQLLDKVKYINSEGQTGIIYGRKITAMDANLNQNCPQKKT